MKEKMAKLMMGRYGNDNLNRFLLAVSALLILVSLFRIPVVGRVAVLLLAILYVRAFSRHTQARYKENLVYLRVRNKLIAPFVRIRRRMGDKTHRYYRCPACKKELRVPKGKGNILVKCPCGHSFQKRT